MNDEWKFILYQLLKYIGVNSIEKNSGLWNNFAKN
jgi:hypothetical protein